MIEKLYITFTVLIVLFTVSSIIKDKKDRDKRKSKEIVQLNKIIHDFILTLLWFIIFIIWLYLLISKSIKVYQLLGKEYINSLFQLFDTRYLQSLVGHFSEKLMLVELSTVAFYEGSLLNMIFWIILAFCNTASHFYRALNQNIFYTDGIFKSGRLIKWDKVVEYKWSKAYENKLFNKGKYYTLLINLGKSKFLDIHDNIEIRVPHNQKDLVNNILKEYITIKSDKST